MENEQKKQAEQDQQEDGKTTCDSNSGANKPNTASGSPIQGDVHVSEGDFVGRDKITIEGSTRIIVEQEAASRPDPELGELFGVPNLPPNYLPRANDLKLLRAALLSNDMQPVALYGAPKVGIQGMGGIGKSVLASGLARDESIRRRFKDGIIWLSIGQKADANTLLIRQLQFARYFQETIEPFFDLEQGRAVLSRLLAEHACLLILDDVWQAQHVEAFDVLGCESQVLLTTRDQSILTTFDAAAIPLDVMSEEQSLELICRWLKLKREDLPPEAYEVADLCNYLPLALSVCAALIRDGETWQDLLDALQESDLDYLEHTSGNLVNFVRISIDVLSPDKQRRYRELAVFPRSEPIPEAAVRTLWSHTGGRRGREYSKLVTELKNKALLRRLMGNSPNRILWLHDLQHDVLRYLHQHSGKPLAELHQTLLDAYAVRCRTEQQPDGSSRVGWHTGPDDGYFFQRLAYHLAEAGHAGDLAVLLQDESWLSIRLQLGGFNGLMGDLVTCIDHLSEQTPENDALYQPLYRAYQTVQEQIRQGTLEPQLLIRELIHSRSA